MIDTNKVDHKTWQWRPSLTNHKPVVRELTNEKLRYTRAAFLSSLSIVVSKYGTDYKASSIPRSDVRAVLGPGFILLSAWNSSTQISSDYIYDHRNKSILWINELWLLAVSGQVSMFPPRLNLNSTLFTEATFHIKVWSMLNAAGWLFLLCWWSAFKTSTRRRLIKQYELRALHCPKSSLGFDFWA